MTKLLQFHLPVMYDESTNIVNLLDRAILVLCIGVRFNAWIGSRRETTTEQTNEEQAGGKLRSEEARKQPHGKGVDVGHDFSPSAVKATTTERATEGRERGRRSIPPSLPTKRKGPPHIEAGPTSHVALRTICLQRPTCAPFCPANPAGPLPLSTTLPPA